MQVTLTQLVRFLAQQVADITTAAIPKARDWFRSGDYFQTDFVIDDAIGAAAIMGIAIYLAMSENGLGFSQWDQLPANCSRGRHLGKIVKLESLSAEAQAHIKRRLAEGE